MDLLFNICWLISGWHLGDTRQVYKCEINNSLGEDLHHDLHRGDILVPSADSICVDFYLLSYFCEIIKFLAGLVNEFNPFSLGGWSVYQSDLNGPPRHNISASWQEVSAYYGFKHATLARALPSNNHNLRQVRVERYLGSNKDFLKLAY